MQGGAHVEMEEPLEDMEEPLDEMEEPSVEIEKRSVEIDKASVEMEKRSVEMDKASVEMESPSVEMEKPSVEMEKPSVEMDEPSVEMEEPLVEMDRPSIRMKKPSVKIEKPVVEEPVEEETSGVKMFPVDNEEEEEEDIGSFSGDGLSLDSCVRSSSETVDSVPMWGRLAIRTYFRAFDSEKQLPTMGKQESEVSASLSDECAVVSDESFYATPPEDTITEMEAAGIIAVLEDAVDELRILGLAISEASCQPEVVYRSLEERFRGDAGTNNAIIDVDTDKPVAETMEASQLVKVQRDRAFAEKTLEQTLGELKANGTFNVLMAAVAQEAFTIEEEENLLKEEKVNSATLHKLKQEIKRNQEEFAQLMDEGENKLAEIKDTLQDRYFGGLMKVRFVKAWERSRDAQNSLKHSIENNGLQKDLDQTNFNLDVEQRVHTEIEDFIRQTQGKLEDEIEAWMEKYDQEIDQRELDINILKTERAVHYKQFEDLALLYQHHKNEITDWLEKKAIKEAQRMHELMLYNAATRIQAWWKGIMVRHHLGPFRKKKKGKGKDKKGKKKK